MSECPIILAVFWTVVTFNTYTLYFVAMLEYNVTA